MSNFKCNVCSREFLKRNHLTHHVSSTHGIKSEEYIKNNISDFISGNWKLCEDCNSPFKGRSLKCGECYSKTHTIKDQFIICKHCNQSIHSKVLSQHLKKNHSVLFENYLKENLEDFKKFGWSECAVCKTITKSRGRKHDATCSRKCMGEYRKIEYKGRTGIKHTDETKRKISENNIKYYSIKDNHPMFGKCHTKEVREKISKTRIDRKVAIGEKNGMFGKTHTPESIKKIMSHRPMNKLERMVANELNRKNLKYTFQFFINENGICKSYDFKIKGKPLIIEVDGDFWHGNPNTKHHHINVEKTRKNDALKEILAKSKGYRIVRFWESDIKKDSSMVSNKLKELLFI